MKIPTINLKRASLLIIEDDQDQWTIMEQALSSTCVGVKLIRVSNPEDALAYLNDCLKVGIRFPSLILLDLYLPKREMGWKLLQEIRSLPSPVNLLPIVILSNSNVKDDISDSYNCGVTAYVVKPIDLSSWIQIFQSLREYWLETVSLPNFTHFW